jgi:hypothetical protein
LLSDSGASLLDNNHRGNILALHVLLSDSGASLLRYYLIKMYLNQTTKHVKLKCLHDGYYVIKMHLNQTTKHVKLKCF